jgi:SpoVK/Ycf46/Vps4 family AAA+-type ATPase
MTNDNPGNEVDTTTTPAAAAAVSKTNNDISTPRTPPGTTPLARMPLSSTAALLVETIHCMRRGVQVPRSFLLSGPPGVGKTHCVRMAMEHFQQPPTKGQAHPDDCGGGGGGTIRLVSLRGSELLAKGHPSDAARALAQQFQQAAMDVVPVRPIPHDLDEHAMTTTVQRNADIVLVFLDECDALLSVEPVVAMLATLLDQLSSSSPMSSSTSSSSSCPNGKLGWGQFLVVAATNRVDSIPATLRRAGRLDREIPMAPPTAVERATILTSLLCHTEQEHYQHPNAVTESSSATNGKISDADTTKRNSAQIVPDEWEDAEALRHVADLCVGYVAADLAALVQRAAFYAIPSDDEKDHGSHTAGAVRITPRLLERAMKDVGASALRDAALSAPPKITWDDIAGDPGGAKVRSIFFIFWVRHR